MRTHTRASNRRPDNSGVSSRAGATTPPTPAPSPGVNRYTREHGTHRKARGRSGSGMRRLQPTPREPAVKNYIPRGGRKKKEEKKKVPARSASRRGVGLAEGNSCRSPRSRLPLSGGEMLRQGRQKDDLRKNGTTCNYAAHAHTRPPRISRDKPERRLFMTPRLRGRLSNCSPRLREDEKQQRRMHS